MFRTIRLSDSLWAKRVLLPILLFTSLLFFLYSTTEKHKPESFQPAHLPPLISISWYPEDNSSQSLNLQPLQSTSAQRLPVPLWNSTFSEDLTYPLNVDMLETVRRVLANEPVREKPVNQPNLSYIVPNTDKCARIERLTGSPPDLLILIKSAPHNVQQREAIRISWGGENCWGGRHVVRLFLLGDSDDNETRLELDIEAQHYGDIVQQNFTDHYFNNTYKLMMGIDWAVRYCSGTEMIMFVDDDYFVYPKNVVAFIESLSIGMRTRFVGGYLWRNPTPVRKKKGARPQKWAIDWKEYPHKYYPPYLAAGNFFLSMPVALEVNIAMRYTQYLRFDDVFLGIVLNKLLLNPVHLSRVYSFVGAKATKDLRNMLSSHFYASTSAKLSLWKRLNCESFCLYSA